MGAADFLNQIRAAGITVSADGDGLRLTPRALLTDELRALARQHKADLLAILTPSTPSAPDRMLPFVELQADFDACMRVLRPASEAPYAADLRGVIRDHGQDYAANWIRGWRETLETQGAGADDLPTAEPDDRRTCRQCVKRRQVDGRCMALPADDGIPAFPDALLPRRCPAFAPKPEDPDQRPPAERWPGHTE